jgi:hypothetical protein
MECRARGFDRRTRFRLRGVAMTDALEQAICARVVRVLRNAAARQRSIASEGTSSLADKPDVALRSPEAACAVNLAADWTEIADLLSGVGR